MIESPFKIASHRCTVKAEKYMKLENIAVFCGSSGSMADCYIEATQALARTMAAAGLNLIYGGATVGLMGILADEMLRQGGKVVGVIPRHLADWEIAHTGLTDLVVVDSMHARKLEMANRADAFIMMPGGIGSVEEFFEMFTWNKLGLINKPCGILNTQQYFAHLLLFLDHMVAQGFLTSGIKDRVQIAETPERVLAILESFKLETAACAR
jgi:uncharacterized protein (TIGR00730 family)